MCFSASEELVCVVRESQTAGNTGKITWIYSGVPRYPISLLVSYSEPCYCYFQNFVIVTRSTVEGFRAFSQGWVSLLVYLSMNLGMIWIPGPGHRPWEQLSTSNAGIHTAELWGHGSWRLCFTDVWLRSRWLRSVIRLMTLLKWNERSLGDEQHLSQQRLEGRGQSWVLRATLH